LWASKEGSATAAVQYDSCSCVVLAVQHGELLSFMNNGAAMLVVSASCGMLSMLIAAGTPVAMHGVRDDCCSHIIQVSPNAKV
jgi:hypothetical protein